MKSLLTNLSVILISAIALESFVSSNEIEEKTNIVLIMADDLGFECIGANGGTSYPTPTLDRMAKSGVRFEHCYSQPLCTPSRVKLMTGMSNVRNYAKFGLLEKSQTTFGNVLRDNGYKTCIVGKWQLGQDLSLPNHFGFDEHCLWQLSRRPSRFPSPGLELNGKEKDFPGEYGPDVCTQYACDFIERNKQHPFLLYYPMILTHCPFEPTPDSDDWDPNSKGSKTYKGDSKYFGDMVTYMDKLVGRILDQLEESGVRDNTLVIFTGDNGTDKPIVSDFKGRKVAGAKSKTTDAGCRVPLIVDWPAHGAKGVVSNDLVDFSDMFPTICEAAQIKIPKSLTIDGQSFLAPIKGKQDPNKRKWIYIWYSRNGGPTGAEFTRNQAYKLYRSGQFFNVKRDPLEKNPLSDDALNAEHNRVRSELKNALDRFKDARPKRFANWQNNKAKKKQ